MGYSRISVNTVYQKVQALANKEQRGYITPKNFNIFANQAQQEIFDNYFHDLRTAQLKSKNNKEYSDEIETLESRISMHAVVSTVAASANGQYGIPSNLYSISSITTFRSDISKLVYIERVDDSDLIEILANPLTSPVLTRPVYIERDGSITVYPHPFSNDIIINYITRPQDANWAYVVVSTKAMYNSNESIDFDLHVSEEHNLVMRILQLAGIATKDVELVSVAAQDAANTENKKNN
jgi:hypothetical protein